MKCSVLRKRLRTTELDHGKWFSYFMFLFYYKVTFEIGFLAYNKKHNLLSQTMGDAVVLVSGTVVMEWHAFSAKYAITRIPTCCVNKVLPCVYFCIKGRRFIKL